MEPTATASEGGFIKTATQDPRILLNINRRNLPFVCQVQRNGTRAGEQIANTGVRRSYLSNRATNRTEQTALAAQVVNRPDLLPKVRPGKPARPDRADR